ncbi:hypothetical protein BUALT_Bualt11G0042100 [Buddleja alternifolia]|uniref:Vitamin K epoxide reductase domain-containing protein n=1 Tax=Buddleja alternifolia TaxID=168488 RepID=A0AAV6X0H2_9LAMI|nr:hypothetical protein BUALT_Bualt11G0042100 [Buddleja alternifolia]
MHELMMTTTKTSFFNISSSSLSSSLPLHQTLSLSFPSPHSFSPPLLHLKKGIWGQGLRLVQVNCVSKHSKQSAESESKRITPSSSESSSSSPARIDGDDDSTSISSYRWCAGLGAIGFVETAYLTFLKLTNSDAFCPTGGASCTTILTSEYSSVFGVPLPLFGMLSYGLVTVLGLQLGAKKSKFDTEKTDGEIILIGTTTSMAVASAYFLYILSTEFVGESCLYCLASAILSFSLFFISLKVFPQQDGLSFLRHVTAHAIAITKPGFILQSFGSHELQKILGLQLSIATLVVIALTGSYNGAQSISSSSMAETEIPYVETEITKESSPLALSLAKHLHSIGAKLYGAFWCSHCLDQKEIFGREAAKLLDYVECFPDGVMKGTKMSQACVDAKLEGFPTWIINGQVLSGEKQLSELAELSGIKLEDLSQSN